MTVSILRTADAWWVQTPTGAAQVSTTATTTRQLLADRAAIETAAHSSDTVPVDSLHLVSPITVPCRVAAQLANYASHAKDAGRNPATDPLAFFRKASGSIGGPSDDIIKPEHVRLLDYEVEIGLVIGRDVPVGTTITEANLSDYISGLVVANDVSARDVQLAKTQFYKAKSYPTFTPVGPALVLLDGDELKRFADLRLRLRVNGQIRQEHACRRRHHLPARAGAAGAVAFSASRCRRSGVDRYPGRHGDQRTTQAIPNHRIAASRPAEVEDLLLTASQTPEISAPRRRRRGRGGNRRRGNRPRRAAQRRQVRMSGTNCK
jgi:2-keto-4-pentenoate hydratase/2-oxohepta-3-ene-1,7-dioic acid hydratase in catechol pathway